MTGPDLHRASVVAVEVAGLDTTPATPVTLRISVIDEALADASHPAIATSELPNWSGSPVTIDLALPSEPVATWSVFAHAGLRQDIQNGDWVTTTSVPVRRPVVMIRLERI